MKWSLCLRTKYQRRGLILAAHADDQKSKVPSKIADRFGVSSRGKVPTKVVAIYVFT
jgi:hypothetical protein